MAKKLTITDILAQKDAAKKKKLARQTLYIKSIDAEIIIQEPTKALIMEAAGIEDQTQSDPHIVYHCLIEPNVKEKHKELMAHFGCATPHEIIDCLFKPGEVTEIAQHLMGMAGYSAGGAGVKIVNEIKN